MASIKHLVDIDLNKNQLTNVKLQHISGNPTDSGEDYEGRIFYDSSANAVKFHNGSNFVAVGTSNASGDLTGITAGTGLSGTDLTGPVPTLNIDAAQTGITSLLATDIKIGEDDQTKIDFETANEIHFYASNAEQVYLADGIFGPQTDSDVDLR